MENKSTKDRQEEMMQELQKTNQRVVQMMETVMGTGQEEEDGE